MKTKKFHRAGIHLPVINLQQTLTYYRDTLGFSNEWTWGDKDGGISRDDMRLLFGEDPAHTAVINNDSNRLNLLWFVDDIDSIYAEFRERGIAIASELKTYPYDLREFAFIDINGYYIRVAEGTQQE
jgi:hypothetical protein